MPLAVITIAFDPVLRLSDTSSVRYETIVLAIVILLGLTSAAWIGARLPDANPADDGRIAHFRNARVTAFEKAGHWVHHDRLEAFLAEVRGFLAE